MVNQNKPQDWHTLEAGFDLNRVVAEKLGCKVEPIASSYSLLGAYQRFKITLPNGQTNDFDYYKDLGWEGVRVFELIPDYSTDLNAAFTLFQTELGLDWNLFSDFNGITCELGHWNNEPGRSDQLEQWDKTAPMAIVKAWLKWQERTDHAAPEFPK